jgi:hypothetical protein
MKQIIVEGKTDALFIAALAQKDAIEINSKNISPLGGLDENKLSTQLENILSKAQKTGFAQIGIIIDKDQATETERIDLINRSFAKAYSNLAFGSPIPSLKSTNTWVTAQADQIDLQIACHLIGVSETGGELETLLQHIKKQTAIYADCLGVWRECVGKNEQGIYRVSNKAFGKLWAEVYARWDICSDKERRSAEKNCSLQALLETRADDLFLLEHDLLQPLRNFLQQFK